MIMEFYRTVLEVLIDMKISHEFLQVVFDFFSRIGSLVLDFYHFLRGK